jgi:type II secretory pathway pseudopilin PulG
MIRNRERLFRVLLFITLIGIIVLPSLQQSSRRQDNSAPNEIIRENQNPGTDDWIISEASLGNAPGQTDTQAPRAWVDDQDIKGYASQISINHGQSITFHVSTNQPSYDIDVYRMGWYGGTGGRFITGVRGLVGNDYGIPAPDPITGRIEATFFSLSVMIAAPPIFCSS